MSRAPDAALLRQDFLLQCASRYWPEHERWVAKAYSHQATPPAAEPLPPVLAEVCLPDWASDLGVAGKILVPAYCAHDADWQKTDWLLAGAWYLHCLAERAFEDVNGPIHSYASRLQGWDGRMWQFAWANRIALFLRRLAAHEQGLPEEQLFGPLPDADIRLTFDVDAIRLTLPIRLKQCAFNLFNMLRRCKHGQWKDAARRFGKAVRFLIGPGEKWPITEIMQECEKREIHAVFNFPGLPAPSPCSEPKRWLFDPGYDVSAILEHVDALAQSGHTIGLHPSFEHWDMPAPMAEAKKRLEEAANTPATWCRQHWLRFSFSKTWKAQDVAGIATDCTLGFNDRPGFRNGAALSFAPWNAETNESMDEFSAWPLALMDSHFYDYQQYNEAERLRQLAAVLEEIRFVHGQATVLWHPHTLGAAYNWTDGFACVLNAVARKIKIPTRQHSLIARDKNGSLICGYEDGKPKWRERESVYTYTREIPPSGCALIVMDPWEDAGNDYINGYFKKCYTESILPLVRKAIALGIKVIAITDDPDNSGDFFPRFMYPELLDLAREKKIDVVYHQYTDENLFADYLKKQSVTTLIYAGFASNGCIQIRPTGMVAMYLRGFKCFFIPEASAAVEFESWDTAAIHKATTTTISFWLAELIALSDFLELPEETRHDPAAANC